MTLLPSLKQKDIRCNIAICPVNVLVAATPFSIPKDKIKNGGLFLTTVNKTPIAICIIEDCLLKSKKK